MPMSPYLPRQMPVPLNGLVTLALDLRWSWHHASDRLWRMMDPDLWDSTANPWLIIATISNQRLNELAADDAFIGQLQDQLAAREAYVADETWFSREWDGRFPGQIAYFSMEFGLTESLPIYSGGLGVLAGDFLKTASDLGVPVIGVGLLYQQGYFRQSVDAHGNQIEFYPYNDPTMLPVIPLRDAEGQWTSVTLSLPGRELRLRTWLAQVGRRSLLLLDSNDPRNDPGDRGITSELYGGGEEMRLQQEIVLGIGGWRLLENMGIECGVCHLNEGHAAFAMLERIRHFMRKTGESFEVAWRVTRASNLFTTHTPVAAGFDCFSPNLMRLYLEPYAVGMGLTFEQFLDLGRSAMKGASEPFNMAYLAAHGAGAINGVSRRHGEVSQGIFQPLFPRWPCEEVPVGHVTNGVHMPTWDSPDADILWTESCGKSRWLGGLEEIEPALRAVSDEVFWRLRQAQRGRLVGYLRKRLVRQHCALGSGEESGKHCGLLLDRDVLTLGFARRFTDYKRTNLLLRDVERLARLLTNRNHPVQLVIAGKAHPHDGNGKAMVREWHDFMQRPDIEGKVVFIQDYDLGVAEQLVQGVDVWINTPRRPWEACGTSGMKVLVNGGLNLSVLDGWWAEAFSNELGWAVGDDTEHFSEASGDLADAEALYRILEHAVVPSFYRRDEQGLPRDWIAMMRESMAHLTPRYSSNRMLQEYVQSYYLPLALAGKDRSIDTAKAINDWHRSLANHWPRLHFGNVATQSTDDHHRFDVQVYLDGISPELVDVQLYADGDGVEIISMARGEALTGATNAYNYHALIPAVRAANVYTPRVVPAHAGVNIPLETPLILWYR
ncbi:alpha-glucan family phosphorylase [Mangrovitalea sediminis]|uniref:alpha-glucan family phosphorylase n=1 Tax=Mangrovitalea sediminis TaxID=1982043 RepID=UPI000BE500A2|nr:alpha-glucan family phosphorylase [Mangrovitalea sediminis]